MTEDNYEQKYTDPELRRQLKQEILQSDKGGKPGQWSARKSQMLVREYEKHGGGYKQATKDEAAKSLEEWEEQDWQTLEGDDKAREASFTKRYLPAAVWDKLSDEEKQVAERIKEEASQQGLQHVEWTPAIKRAMAEYEAELKQQHQEGHQLSKQELYEQAKVLNIKGRSHMSRDELITAIRDSQN